MDIFKGRPLVITTKHGKELVMKRILEDVLGVYVVVNANIDTDLLGTFSGEIERSLSPIASAKRKCLLGMEDLGIDLGIANEGSFGPHPIISFLPANEEFIVLIDKKSGTEIIVQDLTTETNFNAKLFTDRGEVSDFLSECQFPSHALIMRKSQDEYSEIIKGISDETSFYKSLDYFFMNYGQAYIETDMRALMNPLRMSFIGQLTEKLVQKATTYCPKCKCPGFGRTIPIQGLPCNSCGTPTRSILSFLHQCQQCGFSKEETYPFGKMQEEPMYCDRCNP